MGCYKLLPLSNKGNTVYNHVGNYSFILYNYSSTIDISIYRMQPESITILLFLEIIRLVKVSMRNDSVGYTI